MKSAGEYIRSIPDELGKHVGKWIAVVDEEIVAVDEDFDVVYQKVREKYPDRTPFIMNIPKERTIPTVI